VGTLSNADRELEVHLQAPCSNLLKAFPLSNGGLTVVVVPARLVLGLPLLGCDGGVSTMSRELELHLDWSLVTAGTVSCL
jgi:hypothetical protein